MRKAFTLMEIMIVFMILSALASFIIPKIMEKGAEAKRGLVCIKMNSVSEMLGNYYTKKNTYPETEEGLSVLKGSVPKDPWGKEFIYTSDGDTFELISLGKDKKESEDDIIFSKECRTQ